ncbi:polyketide cyclase [Streptomyces sulfonofaciens]|uniref:Polyketide cyclase n=1 Tax=Streptomyces sulfonofaciens TaxID=68272 RepID=A0A919L4I1_9ACTN|nr:SRPBCC family protein [Streptomyces sulfonofaciens]GHH84670.1 polyketide cyclase [Streptomyces sulfonofaciens]
MAEQQRSGQGSDESPLDRLRHEVLAYTSGLGQHMVGKMTDKLKEVADPGKLMPDGDGALAKTAVRAAKGANPLKAFVTEKAKGAKDKVVGKAKEVVGMGGGDGKAGDLKAINIIEHIDVGRPLHVVYNQWTRLEDFGSFTNGVSSVRPDEEDDTKSTWKVRVWPSTRSWEATVEEQVPDKRIVWNSEGSKGTTHGAVSFHRLEENLTRVVVVVEYYPSGFFEKVGNIWRAQGRRLRLDLKHFQRYVTLQSEEAEGWRGEIREGEVVRSHEDALNEEAGEEDEGRDDREDEEEEGTDEEGAVEDEDEEEEEEEHEDEDEER